MKETRQIRQISRRKQYLTRQQLAERLRGLCGGRSLTAVSREWQVPVAELSRTLRMTEGRYPGDKLRQKLGVGKEEVLWPIE